MPSIEDVGQSDGDEETIPELRAHESRPGRTVFVEDGNADGWIATDLTVDVEP